MGEGREREAEVRGASFLSFLIMAAATKTHLERSVNLREKEGTYVYLSSDIRKK